MSRLELHKAGNSNQGQENLRKVKGVITMLFISRSRGVLAKVKEFGTGSKGLSGLSICVT